MSDEVGGEGFARRWSRLKRQAVAPKSDVEPEPVPLAESPPEPEVEIPPPAETIPLEEITAWLSKRIPDGWREVALRRVWSADIDIRDFKGLADYAWDYTSEFDAPPGWGPMRATDDIVRLLARAIGEPSPPPAAPSNDPPPAALSDDPPPAAAPDHSHPAKRSDDPPADSVAQAAAHADPVEPALSSEPISHIDMAPVDVVEEPAPFVAPSPERIVRRGGRAAPV